MSKSDTHTSSSTPPPPKLIPVILKLKDAYGVWQSYLSHFPKGNRYTLGAKIDEVFLHAIEYCFLASYRRGNEKLFLLERCIARVDLLKLLLALAWDVKALDSRKYAHLSEYIGEVGRMLGGWRRQTIQKTPREHTGEKTGS